MMCLVFEPFKLRALFLSDGLCCFLCGVDWGAVAPHHDSASSSSRCHGSASCSPPLTRRGAPSVFVVFLLLLLGLVALFFFLLGWWGSPCRVFPIPLVSWFWVFLHSPLRSCICSLSFQMGWGSRTVWVFSGFFFWGFVC